MIKNTEWMQKGKCNPVNANIFTDRVDGNIQKSKRICQGCSVLLECLEYAIENDEKRGVWGGLTRTERLNVDLQLLKTEIGKRAIS